MCGKDSDPAAVFIFLIIYVRRYERLSRIMENFVAGCYMRDTPRWHIQTQQCASTLSRTHLLFPLGRSGSVAAQASALHRPAKE